MAALVTSAIGLDISVDDQLVAGPLKAAPGFPMWRAGLPDTRYPSRVR